MSTLIFIYCCSCSVFKHSGWSEFCIQDVFEYKKRTLTDVSDVRFIYMLLSAAVYCGVVPGISRATGVWSMQQRVWETDEPTLEVACNKLWCIYWQVEENSLSILLTSQKDNEATVRGSDGSSFNLMMGVSQPQCITCLQGNKQT